MFKFIKNLFKSKENKVAPIVIKTPKKSIPLDFTTFMEEEQSKGRGLRSKNSIEIIDLVETLKKKGKE